MTLVRKQSPRKGTDMAVDIHDPEAEWAPVLALYSKRIAEIEDLDAQTEPTASGRKKLNDMLNSEQNAQVVMQARQIISTVQESDEDERLVLAAVLLQEGGPIFKTLRDKFVTENSTQGEKLSEEEIARIAAERDKKQRAATGLRETLRAMLDDEEAEKQIPKLPRKKSTGAPTGKRIKGEWFFTVGGERFNVENGNHVSAKASALAKELGVKTGTISDLLVQQQLDPGALPDAWQVDVAGKRVLAERNADAADSPDDDDDENGDEEESDF